MADEVISTKIVADADFSNLIADVHKVTASLSKLQEQLANSNKMLANNVAVINRNFADTLRSTGQFSTHFVSLTSDVEKFGKNLDGNRLKLKDYFGAYQTHIKTSGGLIRDLAKQQVAMQNAILQPLGRNAQGLMQFNVHVPRGLDEIRNKSALARQELQIMNKVIQDGAVQLINWGKNTQWAGRQLTVGLTLPLSAFGKAAADAFNKADQELTRLTKVYGGVAATSSTDLQKIRKDVTVTAGQLAKQYGASFQETIGLAADIAATGKTGNELLSSVSETTRLAVLGEVDRQDAMKATLAIQTAFKQNTQELSDSINFLNAVENQTSTTLQDLVEAIPKAGPVIKGLGGSVKDLALYLTAMREGGISASEGANALKSGLASLINPTDKAVGQFKSFGIDLLGIVNNNAGNVTQTLLDLQSALDRLNPLQKQQAIENLFGKFQFARMNALFENLGKQGSQTLQVLDLMKASTADLANIAGRELAQVTESASGKYRRAIESLKADLAGVGEQFLTIGTNIINIIDKALHFFNSLPKPIKQALTFVGALTALAGPLIMLTGVLANFFGYVVKGIMHMKAFFKGGEGWKYLTPEMMAAEKAGKLIEQTFYSDAKAASILQVALKNLIDEFGVLEAKAKSGSISVNPAVTTMAGNIVMGAGGRVVNPQHPLAGPMGTRASTHMVPRASLTEEQRMQQTIFGLVPGSVPVNRKIGDAPQIYMNEPLPPVKGLTQVGGVSTGVVAGEAARWHAMMATLSMQSKSEIESLKKQIATTGVVSKEFMNQFDDVLPIISGITDNAAKESALIVGELRAGKLTVEQARQKIIALNLEIERMITQAVGQQATAMGRQINPTMVPTLNQPVVDATGKSNMRELFKKSKTRNVIDKIAGALGVRTSGAGYNIETTRPKKLNSGGPVYLSGGSNSPIVPGPNINKDVVPAMLTPGEFVINKEATARDPEGLAAYNAGQAVIVPVQGANAGGMIRSVRKIAMLNNGGAASDVTLWQDLSKVNERMFSSPNWEAEVRTRHIMHDAAVLVDRGLPIDQAMKLASKDYDTAFKASVDPKTGMINKKEWIKARRVIFQRRAKHLYKLRNAQIRAGIQNPVKLLTTSMSSRPAGIRITSELAKAIQSQSKSFGGEEVTSKIFSSLFPEGLDSKNFGKGIVSEHTSPFSKWGYKAVGNYGQAMLGEEAINVRTSRLAGRTAGIFPDEVIMTNRGLQSYEKQFMRRSSVSPRRMPTVTTRSRLPLFFRRAVGGLGDRRLRFGTAFAANSGGMVPGVQHFKTGSKRPVSSSGGMGSFLGGMGLQYAGSMIPGPVGSIMSGAGMAMQFLPMLQMIPKVNTVMSKLSTGIMTPVAPMAKLGSSLTATAGKLTGFGRVFGPILRGLAGITKLFSPLGIALTVGAAGIKVAIDKWKEHQEALRLNRLQFGMTAESAKKAGLNYVDYNKKIKDAIDNAKALAERNHLIYESMTASNTPLKMTIEQYKKLREQVKSTMGDYIKMFDQAKGTDVADIAVQLKSQFMAAGDAAETATAKIYALIAQSNKGSQAANAISTTAFKSIQSLQDAASQSVKTFEAAMQVSDFKGQADAMLSTFTAIDAAISDTVAKSQEAADKNKGAVITVGQAQSQQINKINNQFKTQATLTRGTISEIKNINPELGKVLNTTDTVISAWSKYQLILRGVTIDLSKMSAAGATAAMNIVSNVDSLTASYLKTIPSIKKQYDAYDGLTTKIKNLQKAAKGQSAQSQINTRKDIESLNKQIAKIKEAADAKINALRSQAQSENDNLELQKLQLDYQQALARGDQDAAAKAQIEYQQFNTQVQTRKAEESIKAKAELDIKPLQEKVDALTKKNQDLADKAALASDSLSNLQSQADTLKSKIDELNAALAKILISKILNPSYVGSQEYKDDVARLGKATTQIPGIAPAIPKVPKGQEGTALGRYANDLKAKGPQTAAESLISGLSESLKQSGIIADNVVIYGKEVKKDSSDKPINTGGAGARSGRPMPADNTPSSWGAYGSYLNTAPGRMFGTKPNRYIYDANQTPVYENQNVKKFTEIAKKYNVKLARGGRFVPGIPYTLNDGGKVEGIKFDSPGYVYPNINTMPKFNIPTNTISGINNQSSGAYSNSTYNIDINLNGTNVTADDIMRRFKSELALINAKEGRIRTVGGRY